MQALRVNSIHRLPTTNRELEALAFVRLLLQRLNTATGHKSSESNSNSSSQTQPRIFNRHNTTEQ